MDSRIINIYLPEDVDTSSFPRDLYGHFKDTQDYRVESSWMFYLMLRSQGIEPRICNEYPERGILLIHKAFVKSFVWKPDLMVVSMQWDYKRDDRAQVLLVSNHFKMRKSSLGWLDRMSFSGLQYFVQPPMHPYLIPRNADRTDIFENIAFLGAAKNLEPAFQTAEFRQRVEQLGLRFIIVDDPAKMNDYSEIDAVLAVRKLGYVVEHKPAQKLINGWRAGVPSILGKEVGFQELHDSDVDYLEVDSVDDVIRALEKLKNNPDFRKEMIRSGLEKAANYTPEAIEKRWGDLFRDRVSPACQGWKRLPRHWREIFLLIRWGRYLSRQVLSFVWHKLLRVKARS